MSLVVAWRFRMLRWISRCGRNALFATAAAAAWLGLDVQATTAQPLFSDLDAPALVRKDLVMFGLGSEVAFVDLKDTSRIRRGSVIQAGGLVTALAETRGYLLVGTAGAGVLLVDDLNPDSALTRDRFRTRADVYAIAVVEDTIIVALGERGFLFLRVNDDQELEETGEDLASGAAYDLAVSARTLFVATGRDGLTRIRPEARTYRVLEQLIGGQRTINSVICSEDAGIALALDRVISFPTASAVAATPTGMVAQGATAGTVRGGAINGGTLAMVRGRSEGLEFISIEDPLNPVPISRFRFGDDFLAAIPLGRRWLALTTQRKLYLLEVDQSGRVSTIAEEQI